MDRSCAGRRGSQKTWPIELIAMILTDLFENNRSDFFSGKTGLLWLPRRDGLAWLLLRRGLREHLYRLCIGNCVHSVLERLRRRAVPLLLIVDEVECRAKRRIHRVVPRSDQASKVRKAGSALNHELQRAGRTYRLDWYNMNYFPENYKTERENNDKTAR